MKKNSCKEPLEKRGVDKIYGYGNQLIILKDYLIVADVARGDGKDTQHFIYLMLKLLHK
jgi:hypothetical protein